MIAIMHLWPRGQNFRHLNVTRAPELFVAGDALTAVITTIDVSCIRCFTYLHISINYPSRSLYEFLRMLHRVSISFFEENLNKLQNLLQNIKLDHLFI